MNGMILAAGMGTRLHPLTSFLAKPAVPFLNRPFIHYSLDLLLASGVGRIVINLHHLPQTIRAAVSSFPGLKAEDSQIIFSQEQEILGTGGAFGKAREFLAGEPFVVSNGKIYFEGSLDEAIRSHQERKALVTMVLHPSQEGDGYLPVFVDDELRVTGFARTQTEPNQGHPYVFTGIQIISPQLLNYIPDGPSDTVKEIYPDLMAQGHPIHGFVTDSYWCEGSFPRRYLERSLEVLGRRGLVNLSQKTLPESCTQVISGTEVEIGTGCLVQDTILWEGVKVGQDSTLKQVIVTEGVHLPPETLVSNAIITPALEAGNGSGKGPPALPSGHLVWPL